MCSTVVTSGRCCRQRPRSPAAFHNVTRPDQCILVCNRRVDLANSHAGPADSIHIGPRRNVLVTSYSSRFVLEVEQLAHAVFQVNFERFLVRQQCVERPVQDGLSSTRSAGTPSSSGRAVLGYHCSAVCSSLAGFQQPTNDQHQRAERPRHVFTTLRHHTREEGGPAANVE